MMKKLAPTALAAVALAGGAWWYSAGTPTQTAITPVDATIAAPSAGYGAASAQETTEAVEADLSLVKEMTLGNVDAPVQVIEYASFTCPHCAAFHHNVFDQLKENYIDTGKISFTNREVYFDRYGLWAGMVARCGDSAQRYFGVVGVLYETQRDWTGSQDPAVVAENLRGIGRLSGLSNAELDVCMGDADHAQALVAAYQQNAVADDVQGTPTFIINGKKYSNMSYNDFASTLDGLLSN